MTQWIRNVLGLCATAVLFLQPPVWGSDGPKIPPNLLDIEHELSMEFETPHTKWAKPYALGTTRVLFFAPWYQGSTDGREIIELMQRFDLEAEAVYLLGGSRLLGDGNPRWYGDPEAGTQRLARLLEKSHDVFFLNRVLFDSLPEAARLEMIAKIREGAGLVISGN